MARVDKGGISSKANSMVNIDFNVFISHLIPYILSTLTRSYLILKLKTGISLVHDQKYSINHSL